MANELIPPKQFFEELDRSCESKIAACERQVNELAEIRDELLDTLRTLNERFIECSKYPIYASEAYDSFYQELVRDVIAKAEQ
jgi:hypothetical protein